MEARSGQGEGTTLAQGTSYPRPSSSSRTAPGLSYVLELPSRFIDPFLILRGASGCYTSREGATIPRVSCDHVTSPFHIDAPGTQSMQVYCVLEQKKKV
jgi:hypothetical protein